MEKNYTRLDIQALAKQLFNEAGGLDTILGRIAHFKIVPSLPGTIHNYYYVNKQVFDYSDLNATLGQAVLFLAGGDGALDSGRAYIKLYLVLAEIGYLIDYHFCDRAFDGYALSLLVHAWIHVKSAGAFGQICAKEDAQLIEDWFYRRAQLMWRDRDGATWATFRPYDNQEIGIGAVTLLAELFKARDPELAKGFHALSDARLVGFEKKNGNLDDTLFYTPVFTKVMWYYAFYRNRDDLLSLPNCRGVFEGMLRQHGGTGIFTLYNWTQPGAAADMMALGAYLFSDGRYKWLANRFIQERLETRNKRAAFSQRHFSQSQVKQALAAPDDAELQEVVLEEMSRVNRYDHVWEGLTDNVFHLWLFWDDALAPVRPDDKSAVLEKTAGQGRWPFNPEPVLPDKVVLREGYQANDMVALVNLWGGQNSPKARTVSHRYPAANEIISLVRGEQFLVQNIDQVTRDIYIHRKWLNAFSLKRGEEWLNAAMIGERQFGVYPAIDMCNAYVQFFGAFPSADAIKSTLYSYHGWTNERTVMLVKERCLIVIDQCFGPQAETGGVRWHLQGDKLMQTENGLTLGILEHDLSVAWLCDGEINWSELHPNLRLIPIYQHHADWDLDLMASGREMGFITLFGNKQQISNAMRIPVTCSGSPAHPYGMGLKLNDTLIGTRMMQYTDEYDYDGLQTDAGAFIFSKEGLKAELTFFSAKTFRIPFPSFTTLCVDGLTEKEVAYEYRDGLLTLHFAATVSGAIIISL